MPEARKVEATLPQILKGWKRIAALLGEPTSVVRRWALDGMPVRRRGRSIMVSRDEVNSWMAKESGKPVHVVTRESDLAAELRRGLSFIERKTPNRGCVLDKI
jgi:hypothetical protein